MKTATAELVLTKRAEQKRKQGGRRDRPEPSYKAGAIKKRHEAG